MCRIVIKRDGKKVDYDLTRIKTAITKANKAVSEMSEEDIENIVQLVNTECQKYNGDLQVETIQDIVEKTLMKKKFYKTAKNYILYRDQRSKIRESKTKMMKELVELIEGKSDYWNHENSNKNAKVVTTQRDYIAGITSTEISKLLLLPPDIVKAHEEGIIHFHDMDYFAQAALHNCDLINLDDMLQNGTKINGIKIERPHWLSKATTIATQIITAVASSQYGGCTITLTHLAPFVRDSYNKYLQKYINRGFSAADCDKYAHEDLKQEIESAVQTFNYQINSMSTTNGQAPFISVEMYIDEDPEYKEETAMLIEEFLKQRIIGMKNDNGVYITQAFPKLLYVLDEDNIIPGSKYYYLSELAAKCTAKRMVPDYISAKVMRELKGDVYPCMGAARGDEHVSIKVNDVEFDSISLEQAFKIIRSATPVHGRGFHVNSTLKKDFDGKCGVYKITHTPTQKYYIGSSKNIYRRLIEHKTKCVHMGTLGELYFINDFNPDNFKYELLAECSLDELWNAESSFINLDDPLCVNHKDSKNNGNFDSNNRLFALNKNAYSDYANRAYTWVKDVSESDIKVKSKGTWQKVLKITYNDHKKCPLKLFEITIDKNGVEQKLHVTEDHPFHTARGRVETKALTTSDYLFSPDLQESYKIIAIKEDIEKYDTYDFEVDNDVFDLSGVLSHNCRSFLTPDRYSEKVGNISKALNFDKTKHHYFGRFNAGVVTISLPDVAFSSKGDIDKFWKIFDERLELCHKALRLRHERLKGRSSDIAPILWQDGALARLDKHEEITPLLYNGYSTISLGYGGLYECVKYMTGQSITDDNGGKSFGLKVMQHMNDKCAEWRDGWKEQRITYAKLNEEEFDLEE